MYLETSDIYAAMDPRLQRAVSRRQRGLLTLATASSDEAEIGVLVLVDDKDQFEARTDVRQGAMIGQVDDGWLVTARVPLSRIEAIRQAPGVRSMKSAQPLRPVLAATVSEIRANPATLPAESLADGGKGAIVGIIDSGFDFAHHNFLKENGSTRLLALWHQDGPSGPGSPFGYGKRYGAREMDDALGESNPYDALGYGPSPDPPVGGPRGTHGTHVADIATGNGRGSGVPGVAPKADIVFVEPAISDIAWEGEEVVETSFGDSVQQLEAARFLFDEAGERPCVVNISLGTNGGPHDGSSLVEKGIDALIAERPNRAVVISAGNAFDDGVHISGTVPAAGSSDVGLSIPDGLVSQCEMELWYGGSDRFDVEVITPAGDSLGTVPLGSNARVRADDGTTLLFLSHRAKDPNNGDNMFSLFLEERLPAGVWTVRLHGEQVVDGGYDAWIERNDRSQASFVDADGARTLGSISCGRLSLAVGSYDAHKPATPLSFFSAAGPTRDGREKPEISAPGHDVFAAHSRTRIGVVRKSGTSMAAPAVTGVVALILAEANARGVALDAATLRDIVTDSARPNPPPAGGWDERYGHGRIDAAEALRAVEKMAGP
jgi:subtilisin family serine protease